MNPESQPASEVVTFYSYKGGTGRTLGLANVGCLLAHPDRRVLMVDWDLEAPGLHRYFRNHIRAPLLGSWQNDRSLDEQEGLLDLFGEVDRRSRGAEPSGGDAAINAIEKVYDEINLEKYILKTDIPGLDLMKAGKFDAAYATTVNTFGWTQLFARSEWLIRLFTDRLKRRYRYVLIDSRTGITDTSNICTSLLPDKLVVVFTPNRQSLTGIKDLVQAATDYRRRSGDVRPLLVFPLPSRVESSRASLRERWRFAADEQDVIGYQPMFENLLKGVYQLEQCDLQKYFDEVQIQHEADYAYGEEIAVLTESRTSDRFSMTRSFETFAHWVQGQAAPWDEVKAAEKAMLGATLQGIFWRLRTKLFANKALAITASVALALLLLLVALRQREATLARIRLAEIESTIHGLREQAAKAVDAAARVDQAEKLAAQSRKEAERRLAEIETLRVRLTTADMEATNLAARFQSLQQNLDLVQAELNTYKGQLGWRNVIAQSVVNLPRGSGRIPSLRITDQAFLWPLRISDGRVEFVVHSSPPEGNPPGTRYLHATLAVGGSTNFPVAKVEYKVSVENILGYRNVEAKGNPPTAVVFSVDQRELRRPVAATQ
jgi:eukaryotic-like serine/threonine-protein kinase